MSKAKSPPVAITAKMVEMLLRIKHSGDVFVTECKDGPSQFVAGGSRMDAWAMARSWANPLVTAYEIKVSRGDFLRDEKWPTYLPYCNKFYFVCPKGVIDPDELPPEVGLMHIASTGTRLWTKKKAPWRDVVIPEEVFRYILISRATIVSEWNCANTNGKEYWEEWLADRKEMRDLGRRVNGRIREEFDHVQSENDNLVALMKTYDAIRLRIVELGLNPNSSWLKTDVVNKLEELRQGIPPGFEYTIMAAEDGVKAIRKLFRQITKEGG